MLAELDGQESSCGTPLLFFETPSSRQDALVSQAASGHSRPVATGASQGGKELQRCGLCARGQLRRHQAFDLTVRPWNVASAERAVAASAQCPGETVTGGLEVRRVCDRWASLRGVSCHLGSRHRRRFVHGRPEKRGGTFRFRLDEMTGTQLFCSPARRWP